MLQGGHRLMTKITNFNILKDMIRKLSIQRVSMHGLLDKSADS